MLKLTSVAALAFVLSGVLAAPALAQKPGDKLPVLIAGPDVAVIREAIAEVKVAGECSVVFVVSKEGKAIDLKPTCSDDAYLPYVERAMEAVRYEPEIFDGEIMESEPKRQPFKFTVTESADQPEQSNDTPPTVIKDIDPKDMQKIMQTVDGSATCNVVYTVDTKGKPKDIEPNCDPFAFNRKILDVVRKMTFKPGEKDGKVVEWPGMQMPLALGKPKN